MYHLNRLDEYPIEKRVSVFMRNDRESPKGQRALPSNQNSYVLRDKYIFEDGTIGYFINVIFHIYRMLSKNTITVAEIRAVNYPLTIYDWPMWLWNKLMSKLKLPKLIRYYNLCYTNLLMNVLKKEKNKDEYAYYIEQTTLMKEDKQPHIMWPYAKTVYFLSKNSGEIYLEVCLAYFFERENDRKNFSNLGLFVLHNEPQVDPRGPGMRIYPHYAEFDHLQGEELVEAYLDSEPMMELILARCEQEVEIRINESLISVEEVIERIRKGLEEMQWRLEVRL